MKKRKKGKNGRDNRVSPEGELAQGKFLWQCGKALLITASYQVFSVGVNVATMQCLPVGPGSGKGLLGSASSEISSVLTHPAEAQVPDAGPGKCVAHIGGGAGGAGGWGGFCFGCQGYTGPSAAEIRMQQAVTYNAAGNGYFEKKQWKLAVAEYREALKRSPGDKIIRDNLAGALAQLGREATYDFPSPPDYRLAIRSLEEALRLAPDNADRQTWEQWLNRAREAVADKSRLSELAPGIDRMIDEFAAEADGRQSRQARTDPGGGDSSVVDLTFLDPNKPIVVDANVVKGQPRPDLEAKAGQAPDTDPNVVDLRDKKGPLVVDPRTVKGEIASATETPRSDQRKGYKDAFDALCKKYGVKTEQGVPFFSEWEVKEATDPAFRRELQGLRDKYDSTVLQSSIERTKERRHDEILHDPVFNKECDRIQREKNNALDKADEKVLKESADAFDALCKKCGVKTEKRVPFFYGWEVKEATDPAFRRELGSLKENYRKNKDAAEKEIRDRAFNEMLNEVEKCDRRLSEKGER